MEVYELPFRPAQVLVPHCWAGLFIGPHRRARAFRPDYWHRPPVRCDGRRAFEALSRFRGRSSRVQVPTKFSLEVDDTWRWPFSIGVFECDRQSKSKRSRSEIILTSVRDSK